AEGREPITARLIADMFKAAGSKRMVSIDLHSGQIQGFFEGPVDHLTAIPVLEQYVRDNAREGLVIVSPDAGRVKVAERFAQHLTDMSADVAFINKRRPKNTTNVAEAKEVIGDVEGRLCILADDMIDTAYRASAKRVTAVCPFYGYERQDRKAEGREPITARLIADMFKAAGSKRMVSIDLHSGQIQGFFEGPVDHLTAIPVLEQYVRDNAREGLVIVSPDAGRVKVAERFAQHL
ncbi:MAG: ribose-phosphate diphosphokinase, partial [Acidimicrobiaceae bacterium]